MLVTLSGMNTLVRLLHSMKAEMPMLVTLSGMNTLVRLLHLAKDKLRILVTPSGIMRSVTNTPFKYKLNETEKLELKLIPHHASKSVMYIAVRLLHAEKVLKLMLVTPFGMFTLVRLLHPLKANSPILVTLSGIVTLVRLLQLIKAVLPMLVTLEGITYFPMRPAG